MHCVGAHWSHRIGAGRPAGQVRCQVVLIELQKNAAPHWRAHRGHNGPAIGHRSSARERLQTRAAPIQQPDHPIGHELSIWVTLWSGRGARARPASRRQPGAPEAEMYPIAAQRRARSGRAQKVGPNGGPGGGQRSLCVKQPCSVSRRTLEGCLSRYLNMTAGGGPTWRGASAASGAARGRQGRARAQWPLSCWRWPASGGQVAPICSHAPLGRPMQNG